MEVSGHIHDPANLPSGKTGIQWIGGLVVPRADIDILRKIRNLLPLPRIKTQFVVLPDLTLVNIQTELPRPKNQQSSHFAALKTDS
jgi:hypothetical protein